jgi:hypothetical protein
MFNNLPNNWNEIDLATYQDIVIELKKDQLIFTKQIQILSIISGIDMDDNIWDELEINDVVKYLQQVDWLFKTLPSTTISIKDKKVLNMDTITLGEFIDIEYYLKNEYESNLHKIFAILLRKYKVDEWGNEIQQPYTGMNIEKESNLLLNESINNIYGCLPIYTQFRENFLNSYRDLFNPIIELTEEEIEQQTEEDIEDIKMADRMDEFSWEFLINNIVDGDITKYEEVLNLPLVFIFNQILFKKLFKIQ